MRSSMAFGSLTITIIFLLPATRAYGFRRLDVHAAQIKKEETTPAADFKWRRPAPPSYSGQPAADTHRASHGQRHGLLDGKTLSEHHLTRTGRAAAAEEVGEMRKTMRAHREAAALRLIHQDYAGPSGHAPNHHRTIPRAPCKH
ncbi:hypothetical protein BS78_07G057600 [Paspalum vaginatum]|nr:hypothetical protein BS78_07G057600 [Paspalum vaginatum]